MDIGQVALFGIAVMSYLGVNPTLAPSTTGVGVGLECGSEVRLEVEADELAEAICSPLLV